MKYNGKCLLGTELSLFLYPAINWLSNYHIIMSNSTNQQGKSDQKKYKL